MKGSPWPMVISSVYKYTRTQPEDELGSRSAIYLPPWSGFRNWARISSPAYLEDVRAHCYWASLVRTLYMMWCVPCHVFQACAPSRNSTKYRADGLCGNLICKYFCWMLVTPSFFSADHFLFWFFPLYLKTKKICTWEVLSISHILFK